MLTPLVDDIWLANEPVSILGMPLTTTMSVVRLQSGSVVLYSPIGATRELREAIEAIGRVAHLYAPNTFHHMKLGEWVAAAPEATLHAPAGLEKKRADLKIDRIASPSNDTGFGDELEEIPIEGFRLEESVLFHHPSKTLIVADLVHNVGRPEGTWPVLYTKAMGFHDRVALSRMIRWTGFADRKAARSSLDHILSLPIERIVVGHGEPVTDDPKGRLTDAFAWLPTS